MRKILRQFLKQAWKRWEGVMWHAVAFAIALNVINLLAEVAVSTYLPHAPHKMMVAAK